MTHVSPADETLAKQVSRKLGREVAAWKVAKLREAGLITWPRRPGKRGKPGRARGSYPPGTDKQVIEALDLIRSKIDKETAAVILYLHGWPVSITARRRFVRRWMKAISASMPAFFASADDVREELETSQSEPLRIFRSVMGTDYIDVLEWLGEVFAGDDDAIRAPHPAIASALNIAPWNEDRFDYEDLDFFESAPSTDAIDSVRRWSQVGARLTDDQTPELIYSIASGEKAWEQARSLIEAFGNTEQARQRLSLVLPRFAARFEVPLARMFLSARRPRSAEIRKAWLVPCFLLSPQDQETLQGAITQHEEDCRRLEAFVVLGNDCPRKLRAHLDEILCGGEGEDLSATFLWLSKWAIRKPEPAGILAAAIETEIAARAEPPGSAAPESEGGLDEN